MFVGRLPELVALTDALATAREGSGRIALLIGPPGIGKTALTEIFAQRARATGAAVVAGRCFEGGGAPALWPWTQLIQACSGIRDPATFAGNPGAEAPDVAAAISELSDPAAADAPSDAGAAEARFRLFEALTRTLIETAQQHPLVVVLEDLHAADRSSLLLLQFVAREIRTARVLIVATLRDAALAPNHALAPTLGELVREQITIELRLAGLTIEEIAELLRRVSGGQPSPELAHELFARTEGNALYVTEILRHAPRSELVARREEAIVIPETVHKAIAIHLGTVSAPARSTLTVAALFGREFHLDLTARVAQQPLDRILTHVDEAIAAGIVATVPTPGRYRFAHVLFAETLIDSLDETERVALHRHAALALGAHASQSARVSAIAHHWYAAGPSGDPPAAVRSARRAAEQARALFAHDDAAGWYARALTALDWGAEDDSQQRATLLLGLGSANKCAGATMEAQESFGQAASLGRLLRSPEILTRAALGFAPTVTWAQQAAPDPAVIDRLEEAVAAWDGLDSTFHAQALARLSVAHFYGDATRRATAISAALAMARRLDDPESLRHALIGVLMNEPGGADIEARLALATELVHLAIRSRDLEALAVGRLWRCTHLLERGDVAEFDVEWRALLEVATQLHQLDWRWYASLLEGFRHLLGGRLALAERAINDCYALGQPALPFAAYAYFINQTLVLRMLQGRTAHLEDLRTLIAMFPDRALRAVVAWAECEHQHLDEARAILAELAGDQSLTERRDVIWAIACTFLAEVCETLDAGDEAALLIVGLEPYAGYWIPFMEGGPLGPASHALGILARTMGRLEAATTHFEHAVAESRRARALPFLARALYEQAVSLRRRAGSNDTAQAALLLAEAARLANELGMQGLEDEIAALAPALAGPHPAPTGANVLRREADVWVVEYDGTQLHLRDTRGLRYLAMLLYHPGREFHATELANGAGSGSMGAAEAMHDDVGSIRREIDEGTTPAPDAQAAAGYRRRLHDLEEELGEAERHHDLGRLEHLRGEQHALRAELIASTRGRRDGTHAERARLTVTKGIGATLARIAAEHPKLGAHLRATIRRGYVCVYIPDPRHPIVWER